MWLTFFNQLKLKAPEIEKHGTDWQGKGRRDTMKLTKEFICRTNDTDNNVTKTWRCLGAGKWTNGNIYNTYNTKDSFFKVQIEKRGFCFKFCVHFNLLVFILMLKLMTKQMGAFIWFWKRFPLWIYGSLPCTKFITKWYIYILCISLGFFCYVNPL